ncbi:hypothetical protein L228DRAFT_267001 [Xylona heveae TC161]|uniref:JmjC domain-containing protein n=1 Tax=Xylona heveae (strain CBS 132557 / TC161) TaxID=1328760 RepID=A0A165IC01_XYLHT|nr:hypothetical protein L228DRAFT_267001 [Xylona heveae TC161]KZF24689.1 hypothetical protein L228DRAFT_267001 [Xylona heveae TC161]
MDNQVASMTGEEDTNDRILLKSQPFSEPALRDEPNEPPAIRRHGATEHGISPQQSAGQKSNPPNGSAANNKKKNIHRIDRSAQPYTPSLSRSFPPVDRIIAKQATDQYYLVQAKTCNSFSTHPSDHWSLTGGIVPKCRTCIEKLAGGGGCRFQGVRAFAPVGGIVQDGASREMDEDGVREGKEIGKRKREESIDGKEEEDLGRRSKRSRRAVSQSDLGIEAIPKGSRVRKSGTSQALKNYQPVLKGFKDREQPDLRQWVLVGNWHDQDPAESKQDSTKGQGQGEASSSDKQPKLTKAEDAEYLLQMTAPALQGILSKIFRYLTAGGSEDGTGPTPALKSSPIIFRKPEPGERIVCDACGGACFLCSWMCVACGTEICLDCWEEWDPRPHGEGLTKSEEEAYMFVPRYDRCASRKRHTRAQFVLICRSTKSKIDWLHGLASAVAQEHVSFETKPEPKSIVECSTAVGDHHLRVCKYLFQSGDGILDENTFRSIWHSDGDPRRGTPIVLQGMLMRFKQAWTPKHFIRDHGKESCFLVDCVSSKTDTSPTTVGEFFEGFMQQTLKWEQRSVKLKDWPPDADFADHFPTLFEDFEQALPFPKHMSRKGHLNLASYFKDDMLKPDLGPKMYCAYPAPQFLKSAPEMQQERATTNLHLDVTDAINIMVYASTSSGEEGSEQTDKPAAVWDIFEPRSTQFLNRFLRQKYKDLKVDDPVNRQLFFLTDADLKVLDSEEWGYTKSFRIFQEPGDAVLIPAGCAHQVANGRSCIKVAVDFISPERIYVCADIMKSFRDLAANYEYHEQIEMEGGKPQRCGRTSKKDANLAKKEDVLQLYNSLVYCWLRLADVAEGMRRRNEAVKEEGR